MDVMVRIILEADSPRQQTVFGEWVPRWGISLDTLHDEGCGCCVNIYSFSIPLSAAAELGGLLGEGGAGVEFLSTTP